MCNKERKEAGESLALDRMYLTGNNESVQSTPGAPAVNIVLLSYIFLPERNLKDRKYQEKKKNLTQTFWVIYPDNISQSASG